MSDAALPVLRTPRLTLRPLADTDTDADAITEGIGNFDVSKWLAVVPYPYGRTDAETFIAKVRSSDKPFWAICDAEGLCGVVSLDDELAYWLARRVWGRGYGFEAAHAAVTHWFEDSTRQTLESGYFEGNDRSGRLLTALGFVPQEIVRRHARSFHQEVTSHRVILSRDRWSERQSFTLYTPRLTIRALRTDDAEQLTRMAVPEVARNMSTIPLDMTGEMARTYIRDSAFEGRPGFRLALEHDAQLIGVLGFGGTPPGIAYLLHPEHWGRGLATEALSAVLPEIYARFPVDRIEAEHFEDNPASGAVLTKLGFRREARGMATSLARLEPAPAITYAVTRTTLKVAV